MNIKRVPWSLYVAGWIGILWLLGHGSLATEEHRIIIGIQRPAGVSTQSVAHALAGQMKEHGGRIERAYTLIDAVAAWVSEEALRRLEKDPNVRYIVPDGLVATPERWAGDFPLETSGILDANTPVELYSWGVKRVKAPLVHRVKLDSVSSRALDMWGWAMVFTLSLGMVGAFAMRRDSGRLVFIVMGLGSLALLAGCSLTWVLPHPGLLGEGVEVALLDTGIDVDHPDLRANLRGGIDLYNHDDNPQDDNGHGSGVAGLLAAAENGLGLIGVAPKVGIWSIKMLSADEQGSISDLIVGIEWALKRGVEIINMSLGTSEDNQALREAIQAAHHTGVLLIAAAGNKGERVLFPAAYPEVIAVAATDRADQRAWFSNRGPEVELSAPGTELLSTGLNGGYRVFNGTSFAVPHVSGVAALLFSKGIRDSQKVRQRLNETAEDLGLPITAQGYGLVDAERAVLGTR